MKATKTVPVVRYLFLSALAVCLAGCQSGFSDFAQPDSATPVPDSNDQPLTAAIPFPADSAPTGTSQPHAASELFEDSRIGRDCCDRAPNTQISLIESYISLVSGANTISWAVYQFQGFSSADSLDEIIASFQIPGPAEAWIGLADYDGYCWRWLSGVSSAEASGNRTATAQVPAGVNAFSPLGNAYVVVLLFDGEAGYLEQVELIGDRDASAPVASFFSDHPTQNVNFEVEFDAAASYVRGGGAISVYSWDWDNDGANDTFTATPLATHRYEQPGTRLVRLTVTDANTNTATATLQQNITGWLHTYGLPIGDEAFAVTADGAGNLYVAGSSRNKDQYENEYTKALILKYDTAGHLKWNRTWSAGEGNWTEIKDLAIDSAGNLYCVGRAEWIGAGGDDALILKFSPAGELLWRKTWGGTALDKAYAVVVDSNDNIYVAGETKSFGASVYDVFMIKFRPDGSLDWQRRWGGGDNQWDVANALAVDPDDNIYLAGATLSWGAGMWDMLVLKYKPDGSLLWQKTWGKSDPDSVDRAWGIDVDSFGNVAVCGQASLTGSQLTEGILVKYNANGTLAWDQTWVYADSNAINYLNGIHLADDGRITCTGGIGPYSGAGGFMGLCLTLAAGGAVESAWQFDSADDTRWRACTMTPTGELVLCGYGFRAEGDWDATTSIPTDIAGVASNIAAPVYSIDGTLTEQSINAMIMLGGKIDNGAGYSDFLVTALDPSQL